jgi:Glycosyl transferase family 2
MSGGRGGPELSVVIVCDRLETIAKPLGHLRDQTVADRIELVVVVPKGAPVGSEPFASEPFGAAQVVPIERLVSLSWARASGVRAARAPIVAFVESHSYPEPGWAEALIAAHRDRWAAVGPGVTNANPERALSWANLLLDYGPWLEPEDSGEVEDLPGHNSSYKREILLEYGSELERLLEAESFLHEELRRDGHQLWMEPGARLHHLNITKLSSWFPERIAAGQRYAGARAHGWSPVRRALYAAASPLIPAVRMVRIVPAWRRCARSQPIPALTLPAVVAALFASAVGELLGYAVGSGDSMERLSRLELHKEDHLTEREREALAI